MGSAWNGLAGSGNYVYGAAGGSGVQVVDISDPANPRLVGGNSAAVANDLVISGNHVFMAGYDEGLQVFDLALSTPPAPPILKTTRSDATLTIAWPVGATNYVLEATTSLPAVSWNTVTNNPTIGATERSVQLSLTGNAKFFRLRQP